MRMLTKPVWSEGMYLGPHHFQLQNRYFEDALNFVTTSLWRDAYGFAGLEVDDDALRNGTLALTHARGIFPDGLVFDMPEFDDPAQPRSFADLFSPVADHLTMYLAVPAFVQGGQNTSLESLSQRERYLATERKLPDQNTGLDERPIQIGRKNFRLLGETELSDQFVALAAARIIRDGSGRFEADPSFMPPCLSLNANPVLAGLLLRLVEILEEKSSVFTQEEQHSKGIFQAGMSARHVAQYWFLHTLNSSVPALRHFQLSQHAHPADIFREMSRLGGALCTFGLEVHPRSLPNYDHANPGPCFAALDEHIRRHLEIVMPSKAIRIPLRQVESYLHEGAVIDERCIGPSRWVLEVQSPVSELQLIASVPKLVKVCSARFVAELIKRSVPGLNLHHLSTPPPQIAAHVESKYFSIHRDGPCWEHIAKTRQVGIYVPAEIPNPQLSLLVLLDD
ncbi:MAG: type VI secretion system baseplate subunit TssK [Terracidiphilus sp.]